MLIFGGFIQKDNQCFRDIEQIYSFNLGKSIINFIPLNSFEELKPVNGLVQEVMLKRASGFEEENPDLEVLQEIQELLKHNKEHDITFKVQNKDFPAHKNILCLRSTYFSNMFSSKIFDEFFWLILFQGGMKESQSKEIILSDISAQAFKGIFFS